MKWLFKPRLNLVDAALIVIGATLVGNDFIVLSAIVLTVGPLLSTICQTYFKADTTP